MTSTNSTAYELIFDFASPEAVAAHAAETIAMLVQANDDVASVPLDQVTFANTAQKMIEVESSVTERASNLVVLLNTSPRDDIRMACGKALGQFMAVNTQQSMRVDSYLVTKQLASDATAMAGCTPEHKRYVERSVLLAERNGLQLDDATRAQVAAVQDEIFTREIQFGQNIADWSVELKFRAEQLEGLTDDFLADLPKDENDLYKVLLTHPTVFPILNTCVVPETRQQVELAFNSRCSDTNTQVLQELVALRHKQAKLLGYESHAHLVLQQCMAKSPEVVNSFLAELNEKLTPLAETEMGVLLALKKDECEARGLSFDGKINMWDNRYYMDQYVKKHCSIDSEKVREFFPLEHVTQELLAMYQELLSLQFTEVVEPHVWHVEVRQFAVHDARPGRDGRLMGYFYIDMFPRPGKFTHAGCMVLQPSSLKSTGVRTLPSVALLVNFPRPTELRPSLLSHSEVETFFHEFGHAMHTVCSETTTAMFSGTNVEKDFVEAPSQMLENWCWENETLQRLSSHYTTKESLSEDVIKQLQSARRANKALKMKRQILLAIFDQKIHSGPQVDTVALFAKLQDEIQGIPTTPGTKFPASFGHMANSYDAQYYGYLWSEVFAMDMFQSRFKKEGPMNPVTGLAYRELILARGGSVDSNEMLKQFLGREPNQNAFLRNNGLEVEP